MSNIQKQLFTDYTRFYKIVVLNNFGNLTEKYVSRSLFYRVWRTKMSSTRIDDLNLNLS